MNPSPATLLFLLLLACFRTTNALSVSVALSVLLAPFCTQEPVIKAVRELREGMRICKVQRHEDNVYQDINERLEEEEEKQAMQDYERLVEIENTAQQTGEQSATLQPVAEVDRLLFAYKLQLQQLQSTGSPVPETVGRLRSDIAALEAKKALLLQRGNEVMQGRSSIATPGAPIAPTPAVQQLQQMQQLHAMAMYAAQQQHQ